MVVEQHGGGVPNPLFPQRPPITTAQVGEVLSAVLKVQEEASTNAYANKRPFAAILLGPDNTSVLMTHFSISHIRHAESELARLASDHYTQEFLWTCSLVSTWEPCAMCTGTLYWANIGRVVYGASEEALKRLTGEGNSENMTLSLECRQVLARGQKDVDVIGPVAEWEGKIVESAKKWWERHRA